MPGGVLSAQCLPRIAVALLQVSSYAMQTDSGYPFIQHAWLWYLLPVQIIADHHRRKDITMIMRKMITPTFLFQPEGTSDSSDPRCTRTRGDIKVLHHARDATPLWRRALPSEDPPPQKVPGHADAYAAAAAAAADDDVFAREPALRRGRELVEDGTCKSRTLERTSVSVPIPIKQQQIGGGGRIGRKRYRKVEKRKRKRLFFFKKNITNRRRLQTQTPDSPSPPARSG